MALGKQGFYNILDHYHPEAKDWVVVNWNLGNMCNFKCSYCPSILHDGSYGWNEYDTVKKFILLTTTQEMKILIELGKQFFPDSKYFEEFTSKYYHEIDYLSPIDSTDKKNDFILNYLGEKYESLRSDFIENCNKTLHYEQLLFAENYFQESRGYYFDHNSDTLGYYCSYKYSYMVNSNFFLELLENESFPERRKTRRFNSNSISMLLNHVIAGFNQHEEKALRLLDLAYELVLNGELTPWEYASSYDHYATYFPPRKSIYGARFHLSENNEPCVNELLYPDKVDSLRKAIGLIPLKEWCENFNYQLPFNYEK